MNSISTTTDMPHHRSQSHGARLSAHRAAPRTQARARGPLVRLDAAGLEAAAASVRSGMLDDLAVLDTVPTGTFSLYDHVLDTIVAVDGAGSPPPPRDRTRLLLRRRPR